MYSHEELHHSSVQDQIGFYEAITAGQRVSNQVLLLVETSIIQSAALKTCLSVPFSQATMMAEDKKAQEELEFINVEPESSTSSGSRESNVLNEASATPQSSDNEALCVASSV